MNSNSKCIKGGVGGREGGLFVLCINNPPQMKKKRDENDKNVQNSEHWDNVVDSCGRRE